MHISKSQRAITLNTKKEFLQVRNVLMYFHVYSAICWSSTGNSTHPFPEEQDCLELFLLSFVRYKWCPPSPSCNIDEIYLQYGGLVKTDNDMVAKWGESTTITNLFKTTLSLWSHDAFVVAQCEGNILKIFFRHRLPEPPMCVWARTQVQTEIPLTFHWTLNINTTPFLLSNKQCDELI